jgi:hypothetical protein
LRISIGDMEHQNPYSLKFIPVLSKEKYSLTNFPDSDET